MTMIGFSCRSTFSQLPSVLLLEVSMKTILIRRSGFPLFFPVLRGSHAHNGRIVIKMNFRNRKLFITKLDIDKNHLLNHSSLATTTIRELQTWGVPMASPRHGPSTIDKVHQLLDSLQTRQCSTDIE